MSWPKMSLDNLEPEAADICCASCGVAEVDDVKLKPCDGCDLVRYCSDACQEDHRSGHVGKCKERAAELRDKILFRQPKGSHFGDCPICFLPIPLDHDKYSLYSCCSKLICKGCSHSSIVRQRRENMQRTCPFCRNVVPDTQEEVDKNMKKRVDVSDPIAMRELGKELYFKGNYEGAFTYWKKAAELGDSPAHYELSLSYQKGEGVEKDENKERYHLEEAAIAGHPHARFNLGRYEERNGRNDRAVNHFIIAANLGIDESIKLLKEYYKRGLVSKEDFAAALRAHYAAVEATKSPQREAAAKYYAAL